MSPAPLSNDPGNDNQDNEVHPDDVPPANLMAALDSSSEEDELEENGEPGIGYQLLAPGADFLCPGGPGDSDEDDEEEDGNDGSGGTGVQLNSGIGEVPPDVSTDCDVNSNCPHPMSHLQLPPLPEDSELKELQELWKTPRLDSDLTPMDQDHVDTVKSLMAGFCLPPSSLPGWASLIPETEWKAQLLLQLNSGKGVGKTGDSKTRISSEDDSNADRNHSEAPTLTTA